MLRRAFNAAMTFRRLIRSFGLKGGMSSFLAYSSFGSETLSRISIPNSRESIYIRPNTTDWLVFHHVFVDEDYDFRSEGHSEAMEMWYKSALARGRTPLIVDCGANIGMAAVWYANKYREARIVAIEPEPGNFAVLEKNIANYDNIKAFQAGISNVSGRFKLTSDDGSAWGWKTVECSDGDIEAITMEHIISKNLDADLFVVKIDIEGAETELFSSNTEWAENVPVIAFESHDWLFNWRATAQSIFNVLTREKIDFLQRGENTFLFSHRLLL